MTHEEPDAASSAPVVAQRWVIIRFAFARPAAEQGEPDQSTADPDRDDSDPKPVSTTASIPPGLGSGQGS
jgi:hypothetical protein